MHANQKPRPGIISKQAYLLNRPAAGLPWVLRVAQEHWGIDFHHSRRGDTSLIGYVRDGTLRLNHGAEEMTAGPGSIIYLAQEPRIRELGVVTQQGAHLLILIVRGGRGNETVAEHLGAQTRIFQPGQSAVIESLFQCTCSVAGRGYPAASEIVAGMLLPILQTINQEHAQALAAADPDNMLFIRCREFITHHYLEIGSVADLARRFGTTHARLCRLFKCHSETPPHQYLLQRKMTYALHELQQHHRSVGEIANEAGFADPYGFSKAFKRVMGFSPSQARSGRPH